MTISTTNTNTGNTINGVEWSQDKWWHYYDSVFTSLNDAVYPKE